MKVTIVQTSVECPTKTRKTIVPARHHGDDSLQYVGRSIRDTAESFVDSDMMASVSLRVGDESVAERVSSHPWTCHHPVTVPTDAVTTFGISCSCDVHPTDFLRNKIDEWLLPSAPSPTNTLFLPPIECSTPRRSLKETPLDQSALSGTNYGKAL